MTTIVRRNKLGLTSIKGIIAASDSNTLTYADNFSRRHGRNTDKALPHDDVYIRWGCTTSVPNKEAKVINSAKAIHRISDKSGFRHDMMEHGLCPETWWHWDGVPNHEGHLRKPVIVRTKTHAQGRGMWVCHTEAELITAVNQAGPGYYINEFIDKQSEYRVFVHQGRVVWVAQKTPGNPNDVAWNVAKGGRFDNVRWGDWEMSVVNNALNVWELTKAHFAGIDVMLDEHGQAFCVEANSAPSQTSPYRQSCVAKAFDWMQANNNYDRRAFPEVTARSWKDAIHPGVSG